MVSQIKSLKKSCFKAQPFVDLSELVLGVGKMDLSHSQKGKMVLLYFFLFQVIYVLVADAGGTFYSFLQTLMLR